MGGWAVSRTAHAPRVLPTSVSPQRTTISRVSRTSSGGRGKSQTETCPGAGTSANVGRSGPSQRLRKESEMRQKEHPMAYSRKENLSQKVQAKRLRQLQQCSKSIACAANDLVQNWGKFCSQRPSTKKALLPLRGDPIRLGPSS